VQALGCRSTPGAPAHKKFALDFKRHVHPRPDTRAAGN
jgi:hypothetical protein